VVSANRREGITETRQTGSGTLERHGVTVDAHDPARWRDTLQHRLGMPAESEGRIDEDPPVLRGEKIQSLVQQYRLVSVVGHHALLVDRGGYSRAWDQRTVL